MFRCLPVLVLITRDGVEYKALPNLPGRIAVELALR